MDKYATVWHIQWLRGTLNGTYSKSIMGYVQALKPHFEDRESCNEAYASFENVKYDGCIKGMFTQIQMHNNKVQVTGAALMKLILN